MNKLPLGTACTTCATAATVPTALLSKTDSLLENTNKSLNQRGRTFAEPTWDGGVPRLNTAKDIKQNYSNTDCLKDYFKNITWSENASETWNYSKESEFSNKTESCLVVEYYRQPYKENKWWGEFKFILSLKDESKKLGLIALSEVKTNKGKLWGSSAAYILKNENSNRWTSSHKKENQSTEIKSLETISKLIPQTSAFNISETAWKDYWGFSFKLENICNENDCENQDNVFNKLSTKWDFNINTKETKGKLWSDALDKWFKDNFSWENFKNTVNSLTGKWEKKWVSY